MTETTYIDTADVAKLIRKGLKTSFPGRKFSVRSSRYAGGSSIRVNWTDGPTESQVKEIVGHFHGGTFDGMTDCMNFHNSIHEGQTVHFCNGFLFLNREISIDLFRECQSYVARRFPAVAKFTVTETSQQTAYLEGYEVIETLTTQDASRMIHEEISKTSAWPLSQEVA